MVQKASACASPGQAVRRVCDANGTPAELWVGGVPLLPKDVMLMLAEATRRYRNARPRRSALPD